MPFDDGNFVSGLPISIERLEDAINALREKRLLAHKQVSTIEGSIQAYQHILDELLDHKARQQQPQPGATTNDTIKESGGPERPGDASNP